MSSHFIKYFRFDFFFKYIFQLVSSSRCAADSHQLQLKNYIKKIKIK